MEMRRSDRRLSEEEALQILKNGEYGVLSTVSEDGMPYGTPISYAYENGKIYMHCTNAGGHKLSNIKKNNKASFTVVGSTELLPDRFGTKYLSVIAFGRITILEDDEGKKDAVLAILKKYSADHMQAGIKYMNAEISKINILVLEITEVSGKGRK